MPRKKITEPVPEAPKPWSLTQADLDVTTDLEYAFATTRCLPPKEIIPKEFWDGFGANVYVRLADTLFTGDAPPAGDIEFNEGFTGNNLMKFLIAHLRSFEPQHEHKIAGLAYMISCIMTIKESP